MEALLSSIAPILPHMAEDAWLNIPWKTEQQSVFQVALRALIQLDSTLVNRSQKSVRGEVAEQRPTLGFDGTSSALCLPLVVSSRLEPGA